MMKLTTYDKYKDSGIEWLGKVPKHWDNYRINYISDLVRGNTAFKKDDLLKKGEYVALQYGKTYKVDEVGDSFEYFINSEFYKKSQLTDWGDIIIISTSETIEDLGHSCFYNRKDLGLIGGEQILLKPYEELINGKYLYYFSKKFTPELRKYAKGLKVFRFNTNNLKQIFLAIPPIQEQTQIANYLDQATTKIDKKIDLLTQKIKHHQDLKTALINRAVTKGLGDRVEMKDSGVELLGEIPKTWKVKRFKDVTKLIIDGTHYTPDYTDNGVHFLSVNDITRTKFDLSKSKFISKEAHEKLIKRCKPEKGDVLLSKNGTIGVPFVVNFDKEFSIYVSLCLMKLKQNILDSSFFYYILLSKFMFEQYKVNSKMTSVSNLHLDKLKKFYCILPSISEQQQIVKYLNQKTSTIDKIIATITTQIEHQKELRKTLINDVVTGKVKVENS